MELNVETTGITGLFKFALILSSLLSSLLMLRHQDDTVSEQKTKYTNSTKTCFISCENATVLTKG